MANKQLMHKHLAELGLSPVSRTRVDAIPPTGRAKFAGLLGGRTEEDWPALKYLKANASS